MIEVPMIDDVLVVPNDLPVVRIQSQRGVVVQVCEIVSRQHEFRSGGRDRRPNVKKIQLRIVTGNHPRADMRALLVRNASPPFIPRLAGHGYGPCTPQLLPRLRIVRNDDAREWTLLRLATSA